MRADRREPSKRWTRRAATLALVVAAATAVGVPVLPVSAAGRGARAVELPAPLEIPPGARLLGPAPLGRRLTLDVVLKVHDPSGLAAFAAGASTPGAPGYGRYLTPAQFAARFGQPARVLAAAEATLRRLGLDPGVPAADHLVIPVATSVGAAAAGLRTRFGAFRLASGRVGVANEVAPRLPRGLASVTTAVVGLDDLLAPSVAASRVVTAKAAHPRLRPLPATATPCSAAVQHAAAVSGWTFPRLAQAYKLSTLLKDGAAGSGSTVAVVEFSTYAASDVSAFQQCYGTHVHVTLENVDGGATDLGTPQDDADIETVAALAPKASVDVFEAPSADYPASLLDELTAIFDADKAEVVSDGWALCEPDLNPVLLESENELFEQAATEGISFLAASGDTGSEGCRGGTQLAVLDPSAQPYVTAVGGTDLSAVAPSPKEVTWNSAAGASGGGISSQWTMPAWQAGPGVLSDLSSRMPCGGVAYCREVPDVSASASPSHSDTVYYDGAWIGLGGTEVATPLWAALVADLDSQGTRLRAGFLNPFLYAAASLGGAFRDITKGDNDFTGTNRGLYPATKGYDMATGLGTPVATVLAKDLLGSLHRLVGFTDAPGTGPPPARLGPFTMHAFSTATCTVDHTYASVVGPTGKVALAPKQSCRAIGAGWGTWSNGYTGDVYYNDAHPGASNKDVLTLPKGTRAFYLYVEPQKYAAVAVSAADQNGSSSGPLQVNGDAGAEYLGFYAQPGQVLKTITVACDDDFAIGELGIAG